VGARTRAAVIGIDCTRRNGAHFECGVFSRARARAAHAGCVLQPDAFGPDEVAVLSAAASVLPAHAVWMLFGADVPPSCAVMRLASALGTVFVRELDALPCREVSQAAWDRDVAARLAEIKPSAAKRD
jgi:hypothetical protein